MKLITQIAVATVTLVGSLAFANGYYTSRFTARTAPQASYNMAVTAGRQLASEIGAGRNRKANSFMRFENCDTRRGGKYIQIDSMTIHEAYRGDLNRLSYVAKVHYSNSRCERDDD